MTEVNTEVGLFFPLSSITFCVQCFSPYLSKNQGISSAPHACLVFNLPLICSRMFCSFAVPCAYLGFCSSTCKFCYLGYCLHFSHTSEEQIQCLCLPFWSLLCLHTYVKCLYIVFACAITVLQNNYTCCCLRYFDMLISGIKVS